MARILLVDDEEYIRQLYSEELVEEGHEVVTAASGHDLLKKIALVQPFSELGDGLVVHKVLSWKRE